MYLEPAIHKVGLVRNASNTAAFINIVYVPHDDFVGKNMHTLNIQPPADA